MCERVRGGGGRGVYGGGCWGGGGWCGCVVGGVGGGGWGGWGVGGGDRAGALRREETGTGRYKVPPASGDCGNRLAHPA